MRIKFVNTEDYHISRPREGWVDVKDKGNIKSRWVVVKVSVTCGRSMYSERGERGVKADVRPADLQSSLLGSDGSRYE